MLQKLIPKNEEKAFQLQFLYTLSCPVICWQGAEDTVIKTQKDEYQLQAMLNIKEIFEKQEAPDYHAMLYLSQRSLVAPLSHTFARIYMVLGKKYWGDKADWLKDATPLEENENEQLTRFKQWIFKKQIDYLKTKAKSL